jgi:hypothetical protein|nr:hypothetical protein [Kofleriaceae bacterium]
MRYILLSVVLAAGACASSESVSQVRDVTGRALPTYARMESPFTPIEVRCGGHRYYVVDDVDASPVSGRSYHATPARFSNLTPDKLCSRILAYLDSGQD